MAIMGPNLKTLGLLLRQNQSDYTIVASKSRTPLEAAMPGDGWSAGAAGPCG